MIKQQAWELVRRNSDQYFNCKLLCSSGVTYSTNKCYLPKEWLPLISSETELILLPSHSYEELEELLDHYLLDSSPKNDEKVSNVQSSVNFHQCEKSLNNVINSETNDENLGSSWWQAPVVSYNNSECSSDQTYQCHICGKCCKTSKSLREAFI